MSSRIKHITLAKIRDCLFVIGYLFNFSRKRYQVLHPAPPVLLVVTSVRTPLGTVAVLQGGNKKYAIALA
jgi:hypothetical protein